MFCHIVATQADGGIGLNGNLLHRDREDLKFFAEKTRNAIVLMGRKTYESLPPGGLVGRIHVVVSKTIQGALVFDTVEKAVRWCITRSKLYNRPVYVIGGTEIYRATFPYTTTIFKTVFHDRHKEADTFYPEIPDNFIMIHTKGTNTQYVEYVNLDHLSGQPSHHLP